MLLFSISEFILSKYPIKDGFPYDLGSKRKETETIIVMQSLWSTGASIAIRVSGAQAAESLSKV